MPTTPDYTLNWGLPKPKGTNLIAGTTQNLRQDVRSLADKTDQSLNQVNTFARSAQDDATEALGKIWYKDRITTDLNDFRGSSAVGLHPVSRLAQNTPTDSPGWVSVVYDVNAGRARQRFMESSHLRPEEYTRVYSSGSWSEWVPSSWRHAPVISGSANNIRHPGVYPIGVGLADLPFNGIGTLQVFPVDTTPRTVKQIAYDDGDGQWSRFLFSSSISAWVKDPTRSEFDTLAARVDNLSSGGGPGGGSIRGPLEERPATILSIPAPKRPEALSKDRTRMYTALSTTLRYSDDDGETWHDIHTFSGAAMESTLVLDNGELLVTGNIGARSRRVVWVSEGLHTTDEQWHEVLEAPHQYIKFTQAWSQATHGRIVLLAEYGPKAGMAWGGNGNIPEGEGAVQVHLSMDYGHTWQVIFNLADYVVDHHQRPSGDLQHLHGIEWDPYWDRIWISWGDSMGGEGTNGIAYSDDLGKTWHTAYTSLDHSPSTQVVGIKAMPLCVLFFGDMGTEVSRIDRTAGKDGPYTLVNAYTTSDSGKYICQGHYRAQREGDDAPLLAAFSTEGEAGRDFVLATMDGYDFEVVWRNPQTIGGGRGVRHPIGPTIRGEFIASTNAIDGTIGNWASIRIPATGY